MITLKQIQSKIKEAIKLSKLTQKELATKLGITQPTISHYVKGDKMPALDTFAKLCAVLEIDANDILCISDFKKYDNKGEI